MENSEKNLLDRLRSIYSDATIEHILRPHNTESIPNADGFANCVSGCGEIMKIWLKARDAVIQDAAFWTNGCAATIACGSMCTDLAKGKPAMAALAITSRDIANGLVDLPEGNLHCAELAAEALRLALKDLLSVQQQPWKKLYRK
jgi:nitrogen fixation protein NifU and related proteins